MEHFYKTVTTINTAEFKDRGSKFMAIIQPISSKDDFKKAMIAIKALHPKADHYCFAYRLGYDKNDFRQSDAGEPSGTAGKPILGQIDSAGLTNILIVVVRYFGGTLLGVPGLINAYKTSAALVIQTTAIVQQEIVAEFIVEIDYTQLNDLHKIVKQCRGNIVSTTNTLFAVVKVTIPVDEEAFFTQNLQRLENVIFSKK